MAEPSPQRQGYHGPSTYEGQSQSGGTKVGWYQENIDKLSSTGRELLETYSGIPPDEVLPHVLAIRDKAFAVWSYACIGQIRFLTYTVPKNPYYAPTLARLRAGATFLDAGCCFGQEIRFLRHREGIPGSQLFGFDLEPGFVDFGYDLFRDRHKLGATMLSGDLLADAAARESSELREIEGRMDVIHVASVLHVWGWEQMVQAAKRLVSFSRPQPGSMIIGNQMGSTNPGTYPMPTGQGHNYRHDDATMAQFWAQVGEETGTRWKVESGMFTPAVVLENRQHSWAQADPGLRMIWFMVTRL